VKRFEKGRAQRRKEKARNGKNMPGEVFGGWCGVRSNGVGGGKAMSSLKKGRSLG